MGCSFLSGAQHALGSIANNPIVNAVVQFTPIAPIWNAANAVYQASQGNVLGAVASGLGAYAQGFDLNNPTAMGNWGGPFGSSGSSSSGAGSGAGSGVGSSSGAGSGAGGAGAGVASSPGLQAFDNAALFDVSPTPGMTAGPDILSGYSSDLYNVPTYAPNTSSYVGNSINDLAASDPTGAVPKNSFLQNVQAKVGDITSPGGLGKWAQNLYSTNGQIDGNKLKDLVKMGILISDASGPTPYQLNQQAAGMPGTQNSSLYGPTQGPSLSATGPKISRGPLSNQVLFKNNYEPTRYARGGALRAALPGSPGPAGPVQGNNPGQSDTVPAMLSHGEFVLPSDVVSHLGDGNNNAGALKLHAFMRGIRKHKGAGPGLPPVAKPIASYMGGV